MLCLPSFFVTLLAPEQLTLELLGRFIHQWFSDGNFSVMKLSIKHAILYKIYITNWHPTSHLSTISTTLANLIYLVGTGSKVNVGDLIYQYVLRHVGSFGINIPIYFLRFLCAFSLS